MSTSKSEASERPRDKYTQPQTLQELLERADRIIAARQKVAVR